MTPIIFQRTVAINGRPQSDCGRKEPVFANEEVFSRDRNVRPDASQSHDVVGLAKLEEYDEAGTISLLEESLVLCDALLYATDEVLTQLPDLIEMGCGSSALLRNPSVKVIAVTESQCVIAARYAYDELNKAAHRSLIEGEYDRAWSTIDLALRANFDDNAGRQWEGSIFMGVVALARNESNLGDVSRCFEAFALHKFGESRFRSWLSLVERRVGELSVRRRTVTNERMPANLSSGAELIGSEFDDYALAQAQELTAKIHEMALKKIYGGQ